ADDLGNFESNVTRLMRWWRDFGIDTAEKAASTLDELRDVGLLVLYETSGKRYAHIPRFGQRMRHLKRVCPVPPWQEELYQQLQDPMRKTSDVGQPRVPPTNDARPTEVEVENEIETEGEGDNVSCPPCP